MSSVLRRLHSALSPLAVILALLALVVSSVGAGYAAATIGSKDIKKNAVTSAKIKKNAVTAKKIKAGSVDGSKVADGSLSAADLVPEAQAVNPALSNGGEGDCSWSLIPAAAQLGLGLPSMRKDRFGRVHLSGYAVRDDAPGGDGACDGAGAGQINDSIPFVLPAGYIPAKTMINSLTTGGIVIVGPNGVNVPGTTLPPGAVVVFGGDEVSLDFVSYDPAGSSVAAAAKIKASGRITPQFLAGLGLD